VLVDRHQRYFRRRRTANRRARDSLTLTGQGTIGLGKLPDAADAIKFQIEE
jgi:hypothetical protein